MLFLCDWAAVVGAGSVPAAPAAVAAVIVILWAPQSSSICLMFLIHDRDILGIAATNS